jgi:hypothetical protein
MIVDLVRGRSSDTVLIAVEAFDGALDGEDGPGLLQLAVRPIGDEPSHRGVAFRRRV